MARCTSASAIEDGHNFHVPDHAIDNDEICPRYNKLQRFRNLARVSHCREFFEQLDGMPDTGDLACGAFRRLLGDPVKDGVEMPKCALRDAHLHARCFVQSDLTCSSEAKSPASASATPCRTSSICSSSRLTSNASPETRFMSSSAASSCLSSGRARTFSTASAKRLITSR